MATTINPWLNDASSNRYIQTYMKGYLDISGGPLILRNAGILGLSGDSSFNNNVTVGKRLAVGKQLDSTYLYALDVSGPMNFGRSDSSFGGNVTINTNLAMGGLIQQNVSSINTYNQQMISVPYSAFVGSGFAYLGSSNTFASINTFQADTSFSRLFTTADASLGGNLFVNSYTTFNNDVSANAEMLVGGDASLNGRLFVAADVSMNRRLFLGGDVSLGSRLFVTSDISANSRLFVNSDVSLGGRLFVSNGLTITDATSVMPSATYGTLTLGHADASGCSSIMFKSNTNASVQPGGASDYASIAYYDSISGGILATTAGKNFNYNYYSDASSTSSSALVINVQANPYKIGTGVDVSFMDNLILQPAGSCIIDACGGSTIGQTIIQPRGGNVGIGTMTPAYSLDISGSIRRSLYNSGEVIQAYTYSNNTSTTLAATSIASGTTTIFTTSFTPKSSNSLIYVTFDCYWAVSGTGIDSWLSQMVVGSLTVAYHSFVLTTSTVDVAMRGGGSASDEKLFPLSGSIKNTGTTALTINVQAGRLISDDILTINNPWVFYIQEIQF